MNIYLAHYGIKRKSGRYPYGSGNRPHQHELTTENGKLTNLGRKKLGYNNISTGKWQYNTNDYIIPKGTEFKRLANNYSYGYDVNVFTAFKTKDIDEYTGVLGRISLTNQLKNFGSVSLKQVSSKASRDIHVPSKETAQNEFINLVKEDKEGVQKIFDEYLEKNPNKRGKFYKKITDKDYNFTDKKQLDYMYKRFNAVLGMGKSSDNFDVIKRYQDKLRAKGYDGIADENDINVSTFKAKAPTIIFDTKDIFKETSVKDLTASEVFNSYQRSIGSKTIRTLLSSSNRDYDYTIDKNKNKKDKYILNSNYTIENLAKDWGVNRLTSREIQKVNSYMDKGLNYDESVKKVIGEESSSIRKSIDKTFNKFGI